MGSVSARSYMIKYAGNGAVQVQIPIDMVKCEVGVSP